METIARLSRTPFRGSAAMSTGVFAAGSPFVSSSVSSGTAASASHDRITLTPQGVVGQIVGFFDLPPHLLNVIRDLHSSS
jgi:hypothetical protein